MDVAIFCFLSPQEEEEGCIAEGQEEISDEAEDMEDHCRWMDREAEEQALRRDVPEAEKQTQDKERRRLPVDYDCNHLENGLREGFQDDLSEEASVPMGPLRLEVGSEWVDLHIPPPLICFSLQFFRSSEAEVFHSPGDESKTETLQEAERGQTLCKGHEGQKPESLPSCSQSRIGMLPQKEKRMDDLCGAENGQRDGKEGLAVIFGELDRHEDICGGEKEKGEGRMEIQKQKMYDQEMQEQNNPERWDRRK